MMAESSKIRKVTNREEKMDIISEIPRNLQETILGFLPIRDAVRTSILSRKWRRCWTRIPNLSFKNEFLASMMYKLRDCHDPKLKAYELVSVINNVLLLHDAPILKLSLEWNVSCDSQVISNYIMQWIPLLARNGIKQLSIDSGEKYYDFNAHQFSCLELTHLSLRFAKLHSKHVFGGFSNIIELQLIGVNHNEGCIFKCPVLERLALVLCNGLLHTNFSAPKLKSLFAVYSKELSYSIPFTGLESLTEFIFWLTCPHSKEMKTSNTIMVLDSLHKIETFTILRCALPYLAAGGSPARLSKPLYYLKNLNIYNLNCAELSEISCLFCIIRSAPNLCKLKLQISASTTNTVSEWMLKSCHEDNYQHCLSTELKIVTLKNVRGCRAELNLVEFLLAHSPSLKIMFVHYSDVLKGGEVLKMAEEMLQFSRVSPSAQIRLLKEDVAMQGVCHWYM